MMAAFMFNMHHGQVFQGKIFNKARCGSIYAMPMIAGCIL
jgi:hypothetical protein